MSEAASQTDGFTLRETIRAMRLRRGVGWPAQAIMLISWVCLGAFLWGAVGDFLSWSLHRVLLLVGLAGVGCWRWTWFFTQNLRAVLYRYLAYPCLRRKAVRAVTTRGPVPEVVIMATTYHEKPWITRLVFNAIFAELNRCVGLTRPPRVVVATGGSEDEETIRQVYAKYTETPGASTPSSWPPDLVLLRDENGKRSAIASALREIVRGSPLSDAAVVFVDGDTILQPGFFEKVLPLFRLDPEVAAVTTNENGYVKGPGWFAEWISLRFGLRHRTMCSVSLSGKLLCLTGRLSVFRGSVATDPSFLAQIEHDLIEHWLWGPFEMLSGDDKSTWYWLSRHGRRMLYAPDALVTTVEVVEGFGVQRAFANIRRWTGNSLRHNWRALKLGPRRLGWFPWWSLIDQRCTMFTVLLGPSLCVLAAGSGHWRIAAGFGLWLLLSRMAHAAIASWHQRRFSAFYMPLVLLSDWAIALTKLWILFHPAKQSWLNRGARSLDSTLRSQQYRFKAGLAHYLYVFTCVTAIVILGLASGLFPILREARLFFGDTGAASSTTFERLSSEATVGMETARSAGDLRPRWVTTATHRPVSLKEQEHFLLFSSEMHIGSKSHEN